MNTTVLILRDPSRTGSMPCAPTSFSRPRIRFAKSVMEVKAHLLHCRRRMEAGFHARPGFVLIDTGAQDSDIKVELTRWVRQHPPLGNVQVLLAAELSMAGFGLPWRHRSRRGDGSELSCPAPCVLIREETEGGRSVRAVAAGTPREQDWRDLFRECHAADRRLWRVENRAGERHDGPCV